MLYLNYPRVSIIFTTSVFYTDKMKNFCGKYTIENFKKKQEIFLKMLIICDDFEKFYNTNYSEN